MSSRTVGIRQLLSLRLNLNAYSSSTFSLFSFSLLFSSFHVWRNFQRVNKFISFLKKNSSPSNFQPKKKSDLLRRAKLSVSFQIGLRGSRTYGRTDGRAVTS